MRKVSQEGREGERSVGEEIRLNAGLRKRKIWSGAIRPSVPVPVPMPFSEGKERLLWRPAAIGRLERRVNGRKKESRRGWCGGVP
jgi:hypothetical protein